MWLMGLYDEFDAALAIVANMSFSMNPVRTPILSHVILLYLWSASLVLCHEQEAHAPFFETIIRYLGGLLSAYALSKDPILLTRADDLGIALFPAFHTPSGLPDFSVNTMNGKVAKGWNKDVLFAEMLSCQLEYKYLSYLTGRHEYYDAVEKVMNIVYKTNTTSTEELFPSLWSRLDGSPVDRMSRTFPINTG